jgi:hypothetical protein
VCVFVWLCVYMSLDAVDDGMSLSVGGYSDKLYLLLKQVIFVCLYMVVCVCVCVCVCL